MSILNSQVVKPIGLCCLALGLMAADPYPPGLRLVNLGEAPYALDPTGSVDVSEDFQRAVSDHGTGGYVLYLPAGTYLVSRQIRWRGAGNTGPQLWGAHRDRTIIKLADSAGDFQNPQRRAGVLWTGDGSADNFWKSIRSLTIDVGAGNPGACGIQYMANNMGTVRDVLLIAGDGSGAVGLDVAYTDMIGPAYIRDVEMRGFDIGVHAAYTVNSLTLEGIVMSGIRSCGIRNDGQCLAIRGLTYEGDGPALRNEGGPAFTVLIDAQVHARGAAAGLPAIVNGKGQALLVRNLQATGFAAVIASGEDLICTSPVDEYVSQAVSRLVPGPLRTLGLPIADAPSVPMGDAKDWANVMDFGADPGDEEDDTAAIQRAIDSGARTIFFPHPGGEPGKRRYVIAGTVHLRSNVERLIGGGGHWNTLHLTGTSSEPAFVLAAGTAPVVVIEHLNTWDAGGPGRCFLRHDAPRHLVMRHCNALLIGGPLYQGMPGAGSVFIEDVSAQFPFQNIKDWKGATAAPLIAIAPGQQAWARQLNLEKPGTKIVNAGDLWILGYKTEAIGPLIETKAGGRTELLGGVSYTGHSNPPDQPMFVLRDGGQGSFSIGEAGYNGRFELVVREEHADGMRYRHRQELPGRTLGSQLTLHAAWRAAPGGEPLPPPEALSATPLGHNTIRLHWTAIAGAGLYRVWRDDQLLAETSNNSFVDQDLPDGSVFVWQVAACSPSLVEGRRTEVRASTPVDHDVPRLLRANAYLDPARIRVSFSKPMAPMIGDPAMWGLEAGTVQRVEMLEDSRVAVLHTEGFDPAAPGILRWQELRDRATKPNQLAAGTTSIGLGKAIRVHIDKNFDGEKPAAGISDNSAWRQGRTQIQVIDTGNNHMLEIKGWGYAQVVLGRARIEQDGRYDISTTMRNLGTARKVTLQLRQMDAPWTIYGSQTFQLEANEERLVRLRVESKHDDTSAVLFLIADGDSTLFLDDLRMTDAED